MIGTVANDQLPITTVDNGTNAYTPDKAGEPLTTTVTGKDAFSGLYNFDWTNLNTQDESDIAYEAAGFLGQATPQTRQIMGVILRHWYVPASEATGGTQQGYYVGLDLAFGSVGIVDFGYHAGAGGIFLGNSVPTSNIQLAVGFDPTSNTLSAGLFGAGGTALGTNSAVIDMTGGMYGAHPPSYDNNTNIQSELNDLSATYLGWEDYTGNGNDIPTTWNVNSISYYDTANGAFNAVTAGASLTWSNAGGTGDGVTWDLTNQNWNNGSPATYSDGSNVVFNDSNNASTNGGTNPNAYNVTLNTTVSPGSVTFNNSAGNYTISGSGSIAGTGSLTKNGSSNVTLSTVNTYSGGTNVTAGTLVVGVNGALPNGVVSITGGTLQLAASTGLATITSLSISGNGTFDLNNNHAVIDYGSGPDPIGSIVTLLKTGYNGGTWTGAGGIVSTAAAANSSVYGIGYADSADQGNPAGLVSGTIEIAYTLLGDANLNGTVDGVDFGILAANFNKGVTGWDQGDFNYDNVVDGTDFGLLAANFNKGASGASIGAPAYDYPALLAFAAANGLLADVPEPASIGLCAIGAAGLLARRRRPKS